MFGWGKIGGVQHRVVAVEFHINSCYTVRIWRDEEIGCISSGPGIVQCYPSYLSDFPNIRCPTQLGRLLTQQTAKITSLETQNALL